MKRKYSIPAVVLGMSVNGLGVVRSLAREGIRVFAVDFQAKDRPGLVTRYAQCQLCPHPDEKPQVLLDFLVDLMKKNGGHGVLLPTNDVFNKFVHLNRKPLFSFFKFALPESAVMEKLLNKQNQFELAKKYNILMPETFAPKGIEDVRNVARHFRYPVIIKGLNTATWRMRFGHQKALFIHSADDLMRQYTSCSLGDLEVIIQEIVQGDDSYHFEFITYISQKGEPLLKFITQKIRQFPCDFGIGASVRSVWRPDIAAAGMKLLLDMGYRGVGTVEFKREERDGQFYMIEINPRLWAQNSLAAACGQDFSLTAYWDLIGEKLKPNFDFKENVKWIAFKEDRASFQGYYLQGRQKIGQWLATVLTGKRIWAIWDWRDPMPFLKEVKFGLLPFIKIYRKLGKLTIGLSKRPASEKAKES